MPKIRKNRERERERETMHLQILLAIVITMASLDPSTAQQRADCETICGNMTIAFPFGSGEGCYHSPEFNVTCNRTLDEHTLIYGTNLPVTNMSMETSEMEIMMSVAHDCYNVSGGRDTSIRNVRGLRMPYFRISTKNRFVAIGCDTYAYVNALRGNDSDSTGCVSTCGSNRNVKNGSCSGVGCCEVAIPEGMGSFTLEARSFRNHTNVFEFNPCSHAFVVNKEKFNFSTNYLLDFQSTKRMPMLLDWAIGNDTCDVASKNTTSFLCTGHSKCDKDYGGPGYRCRCEEGYEGNPYLPDGCKNINECMENLHNCLHTCTDTPGNYTCPCPDGYSGDGRKDGTRCVADKSRVIEIAIGSAAGIIFVLILATFMYVAHKKRKHLLLKGKFFKRNGGEMLQKRISRDGVLFTEDELKKATNNYDVSMIIGKGGFGTVYKGVLSDDRVVAIKRSKLPDQTQTQIEQFINEVIILSQINHRNVVTLIGCCLETEVPLLVYGFIPNGTLYDHIHNESKSLSITWDIRLRIATETAEALSYLHSAASVPIIHRDIKPANILLDDSYVAKVADFGASKLIPMDQTELATMVQGTLGYLDPEYLQTNQLTDKSDVYSFGVVLVELLSGRNALSFDRPEKERNLAQYFLASLKEGRLLQLLDAHLQLNEVPKEIISVSRLAERCLHVKGDDRPTMKEVAIELEGILASVIHNHPWVQSGYNEEESVYLLKNANDDYGCTDGAPESSSTFDSISKFTILPTSNGR